ncbi:MAG: bpX6 domain-containing protein, partial [Blastocatellia bacterium]
MAYLRRLYRSMFDRLAAQGRFEEAAFVLAELLLSNEEAVDFLARHGRLQLAAEMAEARDLAPAIVVRQWFVAGNKDRAIYIARRTGAFQDAIVRLERSDKKRADELRVVWAGTLAQAGDYLAAAEACRSVESARERFLDWLNKAVDAGGTSGARALAYLAAELPAEFSEVRWKALSLLEDESAEGLSSRFAFIETLTSAKQSVQTRAIGRAAVRTAIRDSNSALSRLPAGRLQRLVTNVAADRSLKTDAPAIPPNNSPWHESLDGTMRFEVESSDVGVSRVQDLAYLPDGKMAIALGESGLLLLNRQGKTIAHFDQPVYKLVMSDSGT